MCLIIKQNQWLKITASFFLSLLYYQTVFASSSQGRVTSLRSADESLQDHGIYIILFKDGVSEIRLQHFVAVLDRKSNTTKHFTAEIVEKLFNIKCLTAKLSKKALKWVTSHKSVLNVKENEYIFIGSENANNSDLPQTTPNYPWHLDNIGQIPLLNTTNRTATGKGVDVYVLDSGIHYEHNEFNGRALYPGCDPIDKLYHQNRAGRDCEGHGTHVAGLVGGNSTGVANGVTLFSVRILNCALQATEASLLHGLMCVVNHRKNRNETLAVINLSIAGTQTSPAINRSLQLALDNNIIITASAGNGNADFRLASYNSCKVYPAGYPGVINVGATDMYDNALMGEFDGRTYITNMGECLDVFAPGYKILSSDMCLSAPCNNDSNECITGKTYDNACKMVRSGTSHSTPIVTGAIALLLEKCPKLTHIEIKNILRHVMSSSKVQFCKTFKYLKKTSSFLDVFVTVFNTRDRLLYIGSLFNISYCNTFNGLPLL